MTVNDLVKRARRTATGTSKAGQSAKHTRRKKSRPSRLEDIQV